MKLCRTHREAVSIAEYWNWLIITRRIPAEVASICCQLPTHCHASTGISSAPIGLRMHHPSGETCIFACVLTPFVPIVARFPPLFRSMMLTSMERKPRTVIHVKRAKRFDPVG